MGICGLKEAIEELEDLQYQYENLGMMSEKNYTSIAIETVLQALEELRQENEALKFENNRKVCRKTKRLYTQRQDKREDNRA